jgi:hypothetical protein
MLGELSMKFKERTIEINNKLKRTSGLSNNNIFTRLWILEHNKNYAIVSGASKTLPESCMKVIHCS